MKVIVLGATGFIGYPVAQALSRAGHIVYGTTRSQTKAKQLAAEEIIPLVGEPTSKAWHNLIPTLDVVIDAIGGGADLAQSTATILKDVSEAAKTLRPAGSPKLSFIQTSGAWVHGDNRKEVVSDTTPLDNPISLTAWRLPHEQAVINDPVLNGIVIRPVMLYGRSGSIFSMFFKSASDGKVSWPGTPGGRLSTIHADDLADLYVRAAEKAQVVGGLIFDAANDFTESVDDFLQRLVEVSGAKGPAEYREPAHAFEVAIGTTVRIRPYLARALLDWSPRKAGVIDGLEVYYATWQAHQN